MNTAVPKSHMADDILLAHVKTRENCGVAASQRTCKKWSLRGTYSKKHRSSYCSKSDNIFWEGSSHSPCCLGWSTGRICWTLIKEMTNVVRIKKKNQQAIQVISDLYIFADLFITSTNTLLTTGEAPRCWEGLRGRGKVPNSEIHLTQKP